MDFDEFSSNYNNILKESLGIYGAGDDTSYFAEYKVKLINKINRKKPKYILEYGCGIGRNIPYLNAYFTDSKIFGCDISQASIDIARKEYPENNFFVVSDTEMFMQEILPYKERFDLIFIAGVFHHIPIELRQQTMNGIYDLLSTDGDLFIFEHNPYNPITRRIVSECVFDKDVSLLKPGLLKSILNRSELKFLEQSYCLFFPAFLKRLHFLEKWLRRVPFGGQYYIHASKI